MPYITIRSIAPGTIGNLGASSTWGHAWIEISDSLYSPNANGDPESFGFYPETDGQPYMPGEIRDRDYDNFVGHGNSSPPIYITEEQAQALRDFADQVDANGHLQGAHRADHRASLECRARRQPHHRPRSGADRRAGNPCRVARP